MGGEKVLTIAIPTYNRGPYLEKNLNRILSQIEGHENDIELLISDNCSTDNTQEIIKSFINDGHDFFYNRNAENLGMDGNFSYCFENASAKYVWVLGDDDHLVDGALSKILALLKSNDYGLIHFDIQQRANKPEFQVFTSVSEFLLDISFYITFLSSNIVRREAVSKVNLQKYKGTLFTQVPVYLTGAISNEKNAIVRFQIMDIATAGATNGGYNIFEVFVTNLLNIFSEYKKELGLYWYEVEKYKLLRWFVYPWMINLLAVPNHGLRFKTDNWFSILIKKYWYEPYFYIMFVSFLVKKRHYGKKTN